MIPRKNELEALEKHISCDHKYKFDSSKCNSNQKWNNKMCRYECKNSIKQHMCGKDYVWNPSTCPWKIDKYLKNIISDSVVIHDETIDVVAKLCQQFNKFYWKKRS